MHVLQNFKNGTIEQKREIVSSLGSNYSILDKKLLFNTSFWLLPIKNAYADLLEEYRRLELQKFLDTEAWNALLAPVILRWCSGPGSNW